MERAGDIADPKEARASDLAAIARLLWPSFRPYRLQLLLIAGGVMLEMGFSAAFPLGLKVLIDNALIGRNYHLLLVILAVLGVGVVIVSVVGLGRDYLYARVSSSALGNLRFVMFNHLQWLSMDFFAWARGGGILARFSGDLATVENVLAMILPWGVLPSLDVLANCVILFALDYRLALIAMLVWPLSLLGPRYFAPRAIRSSSLKKESESALLSSVQESVLAQPVIKAYGLELPLLADFYTLNSGIFRNAVRLNFLSAMVERSAGVSILILNVLIIGVGAHRVFRGHLSVGGLVSFETVFLSLSYSLSYVTQYVPSLVQAVSCLDQIQRLMARRPKVVDAKDAVDLPRLSQDIAFNDVTFGYTDEKANLRELTLQIRRGESVAFVGASGSGKSTLLNLLLRFYDPQHGSITFDGHDLRTVTQRSLRSQVAVVFQESFLFDLSVRENIRMGQPQATDEEVVEAARAAEIHEFIASLPQGYQTPAGERGSRFSGGQRQRIAIARAILRNPAILCLDEATSALDAASEAAINETLARIGRGRTVISITHRLRSITGADRIFVLDRGRLAESGTHDELLQAGSLYRLLWDTQNLASDESRSGDDSSAQTVGHRVS